MKGILSAFNIDILDFTSMIGNLIYSFDRWLTENNIIAETVKKITLWIKDVVIATKDWIVQNEKIMSVVELIKNAFMSVGDSFKAWFQGLKETDDIPKYLFGGLIDGIKTYGPKVFEAIKSIALGLVETIKNVLGIHSPSKVMIAIGGFIIAGLVQGLASGSTSILDVLKNIGDGIKKFFENINLGTIIAVGMTSGLLFLANKLLNIVGVLVNVLSSVSNLMNSLASMFYNIGSAIKGLGKSFQMQGIAAILKSIALTIGVLVASIVILGNMDKTKLEQGKKAVLEILITYGVIAGALLGLSHIAKDISAINMGTILGMTVGISVAVLLMSKTIEKLASIKFGDGNSLEVTLVSFAAIIAGLAALLITMAGVSKILAKSKHIKENMDQMIKLILATSVGILLIAKALQMVSGVKFEEAAVLFVTLGVVVAALLAIAKINKRGYLSRAADTIKNVGLTLLLLVFVMKLSGMLKPKDFKNGAKVISMFGLLMLEMMAISKIFKGTEMIKVSASILAVTGSMILLAIAAKICRKNEN